MVIRIQPGLRPQSLATQIARAELQLWQRRCQVDASAILLRQTARRFLTSPWALLLAGGVGFVAGDFVMRTRGTSTAAAADRSRWLAGAFSLLALVRSVVALIPAPLGPEQTERAPPG